MINLKYDDNYKKYNPREPVNLPSRKYYNEIRKKIIQLVVVTSVKHILHPFLTEAYPASCHTINLCSYIFTFMLHNCFGAECRPTKRQYVQQLSVAEMHTLFWICRHTRQTDSGVKTFNTG